MRLFKNKYRIVIDDYDGFEVQVKYWWWPFYMQIGINSHMSLEKAEAHARKHANNGILVKELTI